jgi:hypothetical protein
MLRKQFSIGNYQYEGNLGGLWREISSSRMLEYMASEAPHMRLNQTEVTFLPTRETMYCKHSTGSCHEVKVSDDSRGSWARNTSQKVQINPPSVGKGSFDILFLDDTLRYSGLSASSVVF